MSVSEQEAPIRPIRMEPVLDDDEHGCIQDTLFCVGKCQCWQHRRCASVPKEQYTTLSDATEPFVCPSCTIAGQQAAITCLQECFNALTDEVRALKANIAAVCPRESWLQGA